MAAKMSPKIAQLEIGTAYRWSETGISAALLDRAIAAGQLIYVDAGCTIEYTVMRPSAYHLQQMRAQPDAFGKMIYRWAEQAQAERAELLAIIADLQPQQAQEPAQQAQEPEQPSRADLELQIALLQAGIEQERARADAAEAELAEHRAQLQRPPLQICDRAHERFGAIILDWRHQGPDLIEYRSAAGWAYLARGQYRLAELA